MNFKVVKSDILFKGRVIDLKVDHIQYDSGNNGVREVAIHNGGAVIVPIKDDGKIVLVSQFRYPLNKFLTELPAGKLEIDEDPFVCAVRELEEETGYRSDNVVRLGSIYTTPGFCTEELHIYMAKDLIPGETRREEGEYGMQIVELNFDEINAKIRSGEINDAKTVSGIFMARNYLG